MQDFHPFLFHRQDQLAQILHCCNLYVVIYISITSILLKCKFHKPVICTKIMNSDEIESFLNDVKEDLRNNIDGLIEYYGFVKQNNIRKVVFNPENDQSFFDGSVVVTLEQRYKEFFRSKFNHEMDELLKIDLLEIIRTQLPYVREKLNE